MDAEFVERHPGIHREQIGACQGKAELIGEIDRVVDIKATLHGGGQLRIASQHFQKI
ncbi:MAG: hypothetical protein VKL23_05415 [Cyanobacteriota bacterium]|nr:hypothetical protein [Cyanobacteriota bacterium]